MGEPCRRAGGPAARERGAGVSGGRGPWRAGAALLLGLTLLEAAAAAQDRFDGFTLPVQGQIKTVAAEDLTGDGRRELIVSLCVFEEARPRRWLKTYGLAPEAAPGSFPLLTEWEVLPDAVFWCVGPASRAAGMSGYFLAHDGLWELERLPDGTLAASRRVEAPLFLAAGQEDDLLWLDVMRDWDGDGRTEAMLPCAREARFYRSDGQGGWTLSDRVPVVPFSSYNNNILFGRNAGGYEYLSILFYPLLEPADLNGDGRTDLLALQAGKARCFFRGPDGRLDPDGVLWDLDIRTAEERERKQATVTFRVADLNRDGCADMVVHKVGVKFTDWSSETAIFLGNRSGTLPDRPAQRFTSGGLLSGVSIEDLDADGYPDLVLWSLKMGLWPFMEILLRQAVTINSQYFYPSWPRGFPDKPAEKLAHEFRIDMKMQHFFRGIVPNSSGDFNGDGVKDLVGGKDLDTAGIYLGRAGKGFESGAWTTLDMPGVNYVTTGDLNGDGLCDLFGYRVEEKSSQVLVWIQKPRGDDG